MAANTDKKINYYVRIPYYMGGETHPRYWSVVMVEEGSQWHKEIQQGWLVNDAGEVVSLSSFYVSVGSEQEGDEFISAAWRRWEDAAS